MTKNLRRTVRLSSISVVLLLLIWCNIISNNSNRINAEGLQPITGAVQLQITLMQYSMPNDFLYNDKTHCDRKLFYSAGENTCDLGFDFCLQDASNPNPGNIGSCIGGTQVSTGETSVTTNDDSIVFTSHCYGQFCNPYTFDFPNGWSGSYFKTVSKDIDSGFSIGSQTIDELVQKVEPGTGLNLNRDAMYTVTGQRSQNQAQNTILVFSAYLHCKYGQEDSGGQCKPTPPLPTSTTPLVISTPRDAVSYGNELYVLGTLGDNDVEQMEYNILNIIYASGVFGPSANGTLADQVTFAFGQTIDSSSDVTEILFSVTYASSGSLVSSSMVNAAFAHYSKEALELLLAIKISTKTITLVSGANVDLTPKAWYVQYWWLILIAALLLLFFLCLTTFLCIAVAQLRQRLRSRKVAQSNQIDWHTQRNTRRQNPNTILSQKHQPSSSSRVNNREEKWSPREDPRKLELAELTTRGINRTPPPVYQSEAGTMKRETALDDPTPRYIPTHHPNRYSAPVVDEIRNDPDDREMVYQQPIRSTQWTRRPESYPTKQHYMHY